MNEREIFTGVAETGRMLLESGLVARTWGNFSARLDETHFAITPSGLGYEGMQAEDIVRFCLTDGTYEGTRKPSSEKGIHAEAYRLFADAGFVIHTHQVYATALGLGAPESLAITDAETAALGGIAFAEYGLPGTKTLKNAVAAAFRTGAHTVLMRHHGALIVGTDRENAIDRAKLLEDICRRSLRSNAPVPEERDTDALLGRVKQTFPLAGIETGEASRAWSALCLPLPAQLDDAAQMIGLRIPAARNENELLRLLQRSPAVFLESAGAVVSGEDASDTEALKMLVNKAAVAALHAKALGLRPVLGLFDRILMRLVYKMKYSKQKRG